MFKKGKLLSSLLCVVFFIQFGGFLDLIPFFKNAAYAYYYYGDYYYMQPENLAEGPGAKVYSDSTYNGYYPSCAADGDMTTRWSAKNSAENHWLKVDLGGFYNLTGTEVCWKKPDGTINKYKIEVSSNDRDWVTKVDRTKNTNSSNIQADNFAANTVRYIRIRVTGLDPGVWASIYEFKVYNTPRHTFTNTPTGTATNTPAYMSTYTPTSTPTPLSSPGLIPGKIEAENYSSMYGIQLEPCNEGTSNVGYTDTGDWMDYYVNAQTPGTYCVDFRVASLYSSSNGIQLKNGSTVLCTVSIPNTGDWQTWSTVKSSNFSLGTGLQTLRIYVNSGSWNLNWLQFYLIQASPTITPSNTSTPTYSNTPSCTPTSTPEGTPYITSTATDISLNGFAPVIPSDAQILRIARVTPDASARPTLSLYDKENLVYSLSGDITLKAPEKNKEIILALDTTANMETTSSSEKLNDKIFDYTLFAGLTDPAKVNMSFSTTNFLVNGNIHSNSKIGFYAANKSATIDGNIEAVNSIFAYRQTFKNGAISASTLDIDDCTLVSATPRPSADVPAITGMVPLSLDLLKQEAQDQGIYYTPNPTPFAPVYVTGQRTVNYNCPVYADGDLKISTDTYNGNGLVSASGTITIEGTNVSQNAAGSLCIYSDKDVRINCNNGNIYGIIYAPKGTVYLSGSNLTIYGRIIAQSINSSSYNISIVDRGYPSLVNEIRNYLDSRLNNEKTAAKAFINKFAGTNARIGIISYSNIATVAADDAGNSLFSLSSQSNIDFLKDYINGLQCSSIFLSDGTTPMRNIGDSMRRAFYILDSSPNINSSKFVVVFADGETNVRTVGNISDNKSFLIDGNGPDASATNDLTDEDGTGTPLSYASYFGSLMKNNNYRTYFIAVSGAITQMESIAVNSDAAIVSGSIHYYISAPPDTIITNTANAANSIYDDKKYIEYADDLQFTEAVFNEVFPLGVTVLYTEAPYNYLRITKISSGSNKGRYQVTANIDGLLLHKVSADTNGNSTYTLMSQTATVDSLTGEMTYTNGPVPNIIITVKYSSLHGTITKIGPETFSAKVDYIDNRVSYKDYFGYVGEANAQNYEQAIVFSPDIY